MKRFLTIGILVFAVGSALYVATGAAGRHTDPAEGATPLETGLTVYYFDMGKDCSTCLNLETYTHETLKAYFADELKSGAIRWAVVDVDLPENSHFVEDFGLYTKSVVLRSSRNGETEEFNNLSRIWELVYDKGAFSDYIKTQVDAALGARR